MTPLTRSILVVRREGATVGVAFLVTETVALTCAHVVNIAVGAPRSSDVTGRSVELAAVFTDDADPVRATVEHWSARTSPRSAADDVAVLRLERPMAGTAPVRLELPGPHEPDAGVPVRAFGFTDRHADGVWHDAETRGAVASGWIQINQGTAVGHRIEAGFSGSPLWDPARAAVVGMVVAADLGPVHAAVAIPTTSLLEVLSSYGGAVLSSRPSPFPGLAPYQEHMREEFLGRDTDAAEVYASLTQHRRLAILGPSGHGKSSLALAGVVPLFREAGYDVVTVRPSAWPAWRGALPGDGLSGPTLVVVDQLEEVFDLADPDREALTGLFFGQDLPADVRVLSTLRPDFLEPVLVDPRLRRAVAATYQVTPLGEDGLRDVVERRSGPSPAPRHEDGLVERIVADALASAAPLPLLSHTLNELWDGTPHSVLTHAAYDARGGVLSALDQATTEWLSRLDPGVEDHVPQLLTRLVRHRPPESGGWTRRSAPWTDLTEPEQQIVRGLTSVGLLVTFDDPAGGVQVRLAADTLFTSWRRLREFVETESEFLRWFEGFRYAAERWAGSDRRRVDLLPGRADLQAAETWEASHGDRFTEQHRRYVAAGRSRFRARRRVRAAWFISGGTVLAVLLVLGTVLVMTARAAADQALLAQSRQLADQSLESEVVDPHLGMRQAIDAWHAAPTDEARDRLLSQYAKYHTAARIFPAGMGTPARAAQSADGDVVVVGAEYGRLTLYVGVTSQRFRSVDLTEISQAVSVDVAADGSRVVVGKDDGTLVWFDVRPDEVGLRGPLHTLENPKDLGPPPDAFGLVVARITADGDAVVGRIRGHLVRWELSGGRITHTAPSPPATYWPTGLDAEGMRATIVVDPPDAAEFSDSTGVSGATTIDLATGRRHTIPYGADSWNFSGDGEVIVACRTNPQGIELTRYAARDGSELGRVGLTSEEDEVTGGACLPNSIDQSGRFVTLSDVENRVLMIDLESGERVATVAVPPWWSSMDGELATRDGQYFELGAEDASGQLQQIVFPRDGVTAAHRVSQVLLGDGETLAIADHYTGDGQDMDQQGADHQVVRRAGSTGPALAEVRVRVEDWALQSEDGLRTDLDGERVVSHEGPGRVVVRDVETLDEVTTIETVEPAEKNLGRVAVTRDLTGSSGRVPDTCCYDLDSFRYFFDAGGDVVTASEDLVQLWDADTGAELGRFDLSRLALREAGEQYVPVVPTATEGRVAVHGPEHLTAYLIDLFTGEVVDELATGPDVVNLQFDPAGDHVVIYRGDERLEVRTADLSEVVLGPVEVGGEGAWVVRFLDDGRFALGANNRLEIHDLFRAPDETPLPEAYRFGPDAEPRDYDHDSGVISAISPDGDRVLYRVDLETTIEVPVDPAAWVRDLCAKTGGCSREVSGS
jgi:hypothetical protein